MKNNKLLYSTIFLIVLTLLVRWWVEEQFALVERNEKFVEQAIKDQVSEQELDMIPVLDSLSLFGHISLGKTTSTAYPFYIYKSEKLAYWSNFQFVPEYSDVANTKKYSYIDKPYGQFIVRKWVVNYKSESFEVFSLISLYRKFPVNNDFIQSGYNAKIVQNGNLEIYPIQDNSEGLVIEINGNAIFKIRLEQGYKPSIVQPIIYIDFLLLVLQILLFIALYKLVLKKKKFAEVLVLFFGWAYFKIVLPLLEGTTVFAKINIFDPQYYAVSWFERSFGDLLINTIFILTISFRIEHWLRNKKIIKLLSGAKFKFNEDGVRILFITFTFWIINYPFLQLRSIYDNSQVSLDISQSMQFDWIKITTYVIIVFVTLSTFLLYHTVIKYFIRYTHSYKKLLVHLTIGAVVYVSLSYFSNMPFANLALINIPLVIGLWYFDFTRSLNTATYKRFLYIVLFFGILSGINGNFIQQFETEIKVSETRSILDKKLAKTDPFAEFLFSTALNDLAKDPFIVARLNSPFLSKNAVLTKIKQVFLNSYLNKYEQSIVLFDSKGAPLKNVRYRKNIFEIISKIDPANSRTDYPSVFRVKDNLHNFSKHYLGYIPVKKLNSIIGYVLLELVEKPFTTSGVFPSLLDDTQFKQSNNNVGSFAYYLNGSLVNSVGSIEFPATVIADNKNIWRANEGLYVSKTEGNRTILSGINLNTRKVFLSNFSFIWMITLFPVLLGWLITSIAQNGKLNTLSYTERIIWYLNLAFIIPLIIVTAVTFRLLSSSFERESTLAKTTLVKRISDQLSIRLLNYRSNEQNFEALQERIETLSNNTELDINLFGLDGKLIVSSQPSVFNKKLLAPFINQYALNVIRDKGKNQLILQESIDQLIYRNSYAAIKSEDSGQMLGIISVPFFSSNSSLNSSKREAFSTILNVFVMVLFATMLVTYFAGKWLTKPLNMLREKLRSTSFSEQTEPINIQWSDELGMLIKAYNQMLGTLEFSKTALRKSEKEKAWREAAQQVAHEIKNPLTPMKLTLQRMSNRIKLKKATPEELEIPLQSVLDQVETLNSIASSFSEFAKMPTPVLAREEMHSIIRNAIELFSADKALDIKLQLADRKVYSMVDSKLFSRMLNNLILNAKQSIKESQKIVKVVIDTEINKFLTIKINDNGMGIDSEITERVFIPKFTTKERGSGIGLAMTKHGIENMGGKISFTSVINEGTIFIIEMPIID